MWHTPVLFVKLIGQILGRRARDVTRTLRALRKELRFPHNCGAHITLGNSPYDVCGFWLTGLLLSAAADKLHHKDQIPENMPGGF